MSEQMTSVHLPGMRRGAGVADYGRKSPEEMIAMLRKYAESNLREAAMILAAADGDFRVETYKGVWVQRNREVLREGRKP